MRAFASMATKGWLLACWPLEIGAWPAKKKTETLKENREQRMIKKKNEFQETANGSNRASAFICFEARGEIAVARDSVASRLLFSRSPAWTESKMALFEKHRSNIKKCELFFSVAWIYVVAVDQPARQPVSHVHLHFFFHVCSCVAATATVARMECRCTVDFVATIWKYIVELMARAHCSLAAGFMFILYSAPFSFSCALSLWRRRTKKTSKVIIVVVLHDRD